MDSHGDALRRFGSQVSTALQEVGAHLKFHAKQAKDEFGINLDSLRTPTCPKFPSEVNCSLFPVGGASSVKATQLKTSGNHSFGFDVTFSQQDIGLVSVSVTGVNLSSCVFSWRRRLYNQEYALDHAKGPTYKLNADDVGSHLVVRCAVNGSDEFAEGELGPIDVDVRSKRLIQEALLNNSFRHQLFLRHVETSTTISSGVSEGNSLSTGKADRSEDSEGRSVVLYLLEDELLVKPEDNLKFEHRGKWRFGTDYPRVTLDFEDDLRFYLQVDHDLTFVLRVYNKSQRDLVVLMIRIFHGRTLLNNSFEFNQAELTRNGRLDAGVGGKNLDLTSVVERMSVEVSRLVLENEKLKRDLERSKQEKKLLELDIKSTIEVFQEQIANVSGEGSTTARKDKNVPTSRVNWSGRALSRQTTNASGISDPESHDDRHQSMYEDLVRRNSALSEKLSLLTKEKKELQERMDVEIAEKNRLEKSGKCAVKDLEKLKSENEQLLTQVGELRNKIRKLSLLDSSS